MIWGGSCCETPSHPPGQTYAIASENFLVTLEDSWAESWINTVIGDSMSWADIPSVFFEADGLHWYPEVVTGG